MKISELQELLEQFKNKHGDVEIYVEKDGSYVDGAVRDVANDCGYPVITSE